MFWKFVIFCIKLVSEWPILLPGNGQNAGFYTIYPRASGAFSGPLKKVAGQKKSSLPGFEAKEIF
jgi:hypothetical protein